jgi:hypothetical protein
MYLFSRGKSFTFLPFTRNKHLPPLRVEGLKVDPSLSELASVDEQHPMVTGVKYPPEGSASARPIM